MASRPREIEVAFNDMGGGAMAQFTKKELNLIEFKNAERVQQTLVTGAEKKVLRWLAARMPAWVNSDHLTLLGFAAQLLVGVSYALAAYYNLWLFAATGFLALNWFGDSLDGTLARSARAGQHTCRQRCRADAVPPPGLHRPRRSTARVRTADRVNRRRGLLTLFGLICTSFVALLPTSAEAAQSDLLLIAQNFNIAADGVLTATVALPASLGSTDMSTAVFAVTVPFFTPALSLLATSRSPRNS